MPPTLYKFPRTQHLAGSRLQPGDEDLALAPFAAIAGRRVVVTEKLDGANTGISFAADGRLWLQSRGHFLIGGPRERHYALLKTWAASVQGQLHAALGDRYVLYGEWLYAKHTIFYDALPHYFIAFDVFDTTTGRFLARDRREHLLADLPLAHAPTLWEGAPATLDQVLALLGPSRLRGPEWRARLRATCGDLGLDADKTMRETDPSDVMEGLYLKVEEGDTIVARYKYVRDDFRLTIDQADEHWLNRPIVPNQLAPGVNLFGGGG